MVKILNLVYEIDIFLLYRYYLSSRETRLESFFLWPAAGRQRYGEIKRDSCPSAGSIELMMRELPKRVSRANQNVRCHLLNANWVSLFRR